MSDAARIVTARALRGFGDGALAVLLPALWLARGLSEAEIGLLATLTLLGSALATLGVGLVAHRIAPRLVLFGACALLFATGLGFATALALSVLFLVAFLGTWNPTVGDVSVFLPTEQALLAGSLAPEARTALFARYNLLGQAGSAAGAWAAGLPERFSVGVVPGARAALLGYAALALVLAALSAPLRVGRAAAGPERPAAPLYRSRAVVLRLSALFSLDSFGGGFAVHSVLVLWLMKRFGLSLAEVSSALAVTAVLSAVSQLGAPPLARRIGLIRTMVYTHIPANLFLIGTALAPSAPLAIACLWLRASLSQMDVPARQTYVMSVVPEEERAAAASVTNVPRSLGGALSPWLAGLLIAATPFGWPLIAGGALKLVYDLLLLAGFRHRPAPEEARPL